LRCLSDLGVSVLARLLALGSHGVEVYVYFECDGARLLTSKVSKGRARMLGG
jgi:hypothetical protein